MTSHTTTVHPRIGLLGNPSDLYNGAVLGFTFSEFTARIHLDPNEQLEFQGAGTSLCVSIDESIEPTLGSDGAELLAAAYRRLSLAYPAHLAKAGGVRVRFESDIPRQVGLSGSSGLIVAALQAYALHAGINLEPEELALLAQEAETDELGLIAGPQDRVLQAHGGLLAMDFGAITPVLKRLELNLLPPLLIAHNPTPGNSSGDVHRAVMARWRREEREVQGVMGELAALVARGVDALKQGDVDLLVSLMNRNLELRSSLFAIDESDHRVIESGRQVGAGAKLCGSGGAVVFAHPDPGVLERLAQSVSQAGWNCLFPTPSGGAGKTVSA